MNWKQIDDIYSVSDTGLVKNTKRNYILRGYIHTKGYKKVMIKGKKYFIHRLVATYFIPNPDNKPHVNHIDKNKLNNHYINLEWCTNTENAVHSFNNGRISSNTKLSKDEVLNILGSTLKPKELAIIHNVSINTIYALKNGRNLHRLKL